jgi:hypothetical protein
MEPTTVGAAAHGRTRPSRASTRLIPRGDSRRGSHHDRSRRPTSDVGRFLSPRPGVRRHAGRSHSGESGATPSRFSWRGLRLYESELLCDHGVEHPRGKKPGQSPILETLLDDGVAGFRFGRAECQVNGFSQALGG